jgi:hypothetical protein
MHLQVPELEIFQYIQYQLLIQVMIHLFLEYVLLMMNELIDLNIKNQMKDERNHLKMLKMNI